MRMLQLLTQICNQESMAIGNQSACYIDYAKGQLLAIEYSLTGASTVTLPINRQIHRIKNRYEINYCDYLFLEKNKNYLKYA